MDRVKLEEAIAHAEQELSELARDRHAVSQRLAVLRRTWRVPVLVFATLEYALHTINQLIDVNEAQTEFKGWFAFFTLAFLTLVLAANTTFAWRVHPEPDPEPGPDEDGARP